MSTLAKVRKEKRNTCKGTKGAYNRMRRACKLYGDQAYKRTPRGGKVAARKAAIARAKKIMNGSCSLKK